MEVIEISKKHKLDWAKVNKVTIENSNNEFLKHEHIKFEIVRQILNKHKKVKNEIYTNYAINGRIPDILHINKKTKEATIYEIQDSPNNKEINEATDYYKKVEYKNKVVDFELIELNKVSDNLEEIKKYLERKVI